MHAQARTALMVALIASALTWSASGALAAPCRILTWGSSSPGVGASTCNNPPGVTAPQNLRASSDGGETTPTSTNFPTSLLLVNTKGKLRWSSKIAGTTERETIPTNYALIGLTLEGDPESSTTACHAATGKVRWADLSHGEPSGAFDGSDAWAFSLNSSSEACAEHERAKVRLRGVSLLFETLGAGKTPLVATGTLAGTWEQPGVECPAGGIQLETKPTGMSTEPASESVEVDNGTTGEAAYLCVVSANNYVTPSEKESWKLTEGTGLYSDAGVGWKFNGKFLKGAEVKIVETKAGPPLKIWEFEPETGKWEVRIECKKLIDSEEVFSFGLDKVKEWTWTECEDIKTGCPVPPIAGLGFAWHSFLDILGSKFFDGIEGVRFKLPTVTKEGCSVASEEEVSGTLIGEWNNSASTLEFPTAPVEGTTLETTSGSKISVSGADVFAVEGGGTLEVGRE